jgi:hypothetical protein
VKNNTELIEKFNEWIVSIGTSRRNFFINMEEDHADIEKEVFLWDE